MTLNGMEGFPIEWVRKQFPALQRTYNNKPVVYFDGPGGSQVIKSSIDAMVKYMSNGGANLHGQFPTSIETEQTIKEAREALADLLDVKPEEIAFGPNSTTIELAVSRAIARELSSDKEIVVTEIDHRANVDPWLAVADDKGLKVRWLEVDPSTLALNFDHLDSIINDKTALVAVTLASNAVGTITDVQKIAKRAREVGALVVVDAVHAVPHFAISMGDLGADILFCSTYKFFGPHIGIAAIRSEVFQKLKPYKLKPAPTNFPDKLETGTQNHEGIAGIKAAVEFIASLGEGHTRREKIVNGFKRIESYENGLANKIRTELKKIPNIELYQTPDEIPKTPTIAFKVKNMEPSQVSKWMVEKHGIFIADGDFYATTLADKLGINKDGGWIRAGLAPYNTEEEANKFINTLQELVNKY